MRCGGTRREELPPSGPHATRATVPVCPRSVATGAPPSIRHTRTLPSRQAVATSPSSGLIAASPGHDASRIAMTSPPSGMRQTRVSSAGVDVTASVPSGLKRARRGLTDARRARRPPRPCSRPRVRGASVRRRREHELPVRVERDIDDPSGARLRGVDDLARLRAPEREHVVVAARDEVAAGADREPVDWAGVAAHDRESLAALGGPDARGPVAARSEHEAAVGAEAHRVDGARVAAEDRERGARRRVPDACRPVEARGDGEPAVGAERRLADAVRVPAQRRAQLARRRVLGPDDAFQVSGRDRGAVWAEADDRDAVRVSPQGADLATGDSVEQPHRAVAVRGRDSRAVGLQAASVARSAVARRASSAPVAAFQVRAVPSSLVVRTRRPSGLNSSCRSAWLWPRSVATFAPVSADQTIRRRSRSCRRVKRSG